MKTCGCNGLFAAGFDGRCFGEIGREVVRLEGLDIEPNEGNERAAKIRRFGGIVAAAIHEHAHGCDHTAASLHDVNGFLDTSAARDHIFGDDETLALRNLEPAPQHEFALFFFCENVPFAE